MKETVRQAKGLDWSEQQIQNDTFIAKDRGNQPTACRLPVTPMFPAKAKLIKIKHLNVSVATFFLKL